MSYWSKKRQQTIIWFILLAILIPIIIVAFSIFNKPATCFDGFKNGSENGVDCGGVCDLVCKMDSLEPTILWSRFFKVSEGLYTVAVYIQNPNSVAGASNVPYRIRVYDEDDVTIVERDGVVDLFPKYSFPLIETGIRVGERIPKRIVFEFLDDPIWQKQKDNNLPINISNDRIYNEESSPRVEASLENTTAKPLKDITVSVILYGENGNAIAVSKTKVDAIEANGSKRVVFSWPEPFDEKILRKDIIIEPRP
jgi:hypothetical protein